MRKERRDIEYVHTCVVGQTLSLARDTLRALRIMPLATTRARDHIHNDNFVVCMVKQTYKFSIILTYTVSLNNIYIHIYIFTFHYLRFLSFFFFNNRALNQFLKKKIYEILSVVVVRFNPRQHWVFDVKINNTRCMTTFIRRNFIWWCDKKMFFFRS